MLILAFLALAAGNPAYLTCKLANNEGSKAS